MDGRWGLALAYTTFQGVNVAASINVCIEAAVVWNLYPGVTVILTSPFWYPRARYPRIIRSPMPHILRIYGIPNGTP